jgi:hypothetical protein
MNGLHTNQRIPDTFSAHISAMHYLANKIERTAFLFELKYIKTQNFTVYEKAIKPEMEPPCLRQ